MTMLPGVVGRVSVSATLSSAVKLLLVSVIDNCAGVPCERLTALRLLKRLSTVNGASTVTVLEPGPGPGRLMPGPVMAPLRLTAMVLPGVAPTGTRA